LKSWFFYPETANRSLEEIDLIFAKGYCENISYVKAAKELPRLTADDMEELAVQYGLTGDLKPVSNGDHKAELETVEKV
jgi:hypothetical protein